MGLQILTRRMAEKSMEGDFETDSMRYKVTSRWDASAGRTGVRCLGHPRRLITDVARRKIAWHPARWVGVAVASPIVSDHHPESAGINLTEGNKTV
jgi:hypothetical protein